MLYRRAIVPARYICPEQRHLFNHYNPVIIIELRLRVEQQIRDDEQDRCADSEGLQFQLDRYIRTRSSKDVLMLPDAVPEARTLFFQSH